MMLICTVFLPPHRTKSDVKFEAGWAQHQSCTNHKHIYARNVVDRTRHIHAGASEKNVVDMTRHTN